MKPIRLQTVLVCASALIPTLAQVTFAQGSGFSLGTEITYRGALEHKGRPAEGRFDVTYELWDAPRGGNFLGRIDRFDQAVAAGALIASLDFGADAFELGSPWLEIHVREAGSGTYVPLLPRQQLARGSTCTVNSDVEIDGQLTVSDSIVAGETGAFDGLLIDAKEISVSSVFLDPELLINPAGGSRQVGIGVASAEAPLSLPGGPDASPSAGGALVVGAMSGANIAVDSNEIMARNNGATAKLFLNANGGEVQIGGPLLVGYEVVEQIGGCGGPGGLWIEAVCPAGKRALGGSCDRFHATNDSRPLSIGGVAGRGWRCEIANCDSSDRAIAICAGIR